MASVSQADLPALARRVAQRLLADRSAPASLRPGRAVGVHVSAPVTPLTRAEEHRGSPSGGTCASSGATTKRGLRVAVGSDHGGFAFKSAILEAVGGLGHTSYDLGPNGDAACDYPVFAHAVAREVAEGRADLGIMIDGAGLGSAMAANKVPGVRAASCTTPELARNAREHNYANLLTLGARHIDLGTALQVVQAFLSTPWGAARHGKRVQLISDLEQRYANPVRLDSVTRS